MPTVLDSLQVLKVTTRFPQIGIVTIEDDVEIGANTCVDRSTMGSTYVRKGVKLDNLVQIAHNTDIGANTVMSSQVGVAGSTKVGEWCMFGGQVGLAGHITIGDKVFLGAQSGVPWQPQGAVSSSSELLLWSSALTSSLRLSSVVCLTCTRNSTT